MPPRNSAFEPGAKNERDRISCPIPLAFCDQSLSALRRWVLELRTQILDVLGNLVVIGSVRLKLQVETQLVDCFLNLTLAFVSVRQELVGIHDFGLILDRSLQIR